MLSLAGEHHQRSFGERNDPAAAAGETLCGHLGVEVGYEFAAVEHIEHRRGHKEYSVLAADADYLILKALHLAYRAVLNDIERFAAGEEYSAVLCGEYAFHGRAGKRAEGAVRLGVAQTAVSADIYRAVPGAGEAECFARDKAALRREEFTLALREAAGYIVTFSFHFISPFMRKNYLTVIEVCRLFFEPFSFITILLFPLPHDVGTVKTHVTIPELFEVFALNSADFDRLSLPFS